MKTFQNFNGKLTVEYHSSKLELVPVAQKKGTKGIYPGLIAGEDFERYQFEEWLGGAEKLDSWLVNHFNEDSQLLWKSASEELGFERGSKLSAEQTKKLTEKFREYLIADLEGRQVREKSASDYGVLIIKASNKLKKATDEKEKQDLQSEIKSLKELYKMAKAKEDEELAAAMED